MEDASHFSDSAPFSDALPAHHPLLFYDGLCPFCFLSIRYLARFDQGHIFRFASLQGPFAAKKLPPSLKESFDSILLYDTQGWHHSSEAVLRALIHLGGLWRCLRLFLAVPRPLRDGLYRLFARYRRAWFGQYASLEKCPLPPLASRRQFMDFL